MRPRASHAPQASLPSAPIRFLVAACLLALSWVGCGTAPEAEDPSAALWTEVQQMQSELAKARTEIADMKSQLESAASDAAAETEPAAEPADGATPPPTAEELQAKIDQADGAAIKQAEGFYQKVIQYINESGIIEGQPLTPEQRQAFNWKAEEDIRIAQEYIDKGGDYQRAIDIYNQSLLLAPGNAKLEQAIAQAEADRYMSEERFAQVKKKMSQSQVRELLGQPKLSNIREFEQGVIGWFYKKQDGGAAGVFFRKNRRGELEAYEIDYTAIERQVVGADDEG
jgi:tetratricopeptide (TPR) repeat protein